MNRRSLFKGIAALIGVVATAPVAAQSPRGHWEIDVPDGAAIPDPAPAKWVPADGPTGQNLGYVNMGFGGTHSHSFWWPENPAHAHARPATIEDFVGGRRI